MFNMWAQKHIFIWTLSYFKEDAWIVQNYLCCICNEVYTHLENCLEEEDLNKFIYDFRRHYFLLSVSPNYSGIQMLY